MALQTLNTIKQWFKTGLKPTQTQFWDTWDSFRHKFEKVPVKDVEGIDELLLSKADKTILDNHLADKNAHAPQINTDWNSESGFSQLLNKPEFKTINGEPIVGTGDITLDVEGLTFEQVLSNGNETTQTALFKSYADNDVYTNTINGRNIEMTQSSTVTRGENKTASLTLNSELIDFVNSSTGETTALFAQGVGFGNLNSNHFSTLEMNPATTANYSTVLMPAITTEEETKTLATLDDIPKVNPQSLEETLRAGNNSGGEIRLHDTGATFRLSQIRPDYGENYDLGRFGTLPSQGVANTGYLMLGKEFGPDVYQTSILPNSETTANTELFLPKGDGTAKTLATTDELNNPVSANQSGIVDNTSLQELGGADKLINGIRIGKGNNSTGATNTALGSNTLMNATTSIQNTAIGRSALALNTTGSYNTGVGSITLANLTTGTQNVGIGGAALRYLTTGSYNLGIGTNALVNNLTGTGNVAVGTAAAAGALGNYNTSLGWLSGSSVTTIGTGDYNITIGFQSGFNLTTGAGNVLIGTPFSNADLNYTTGNNNISINTGKRNNGITTGSGNTIIGGVQGLNQDDSNLAIFANGIGHIAIRKEADNRLLAPTLTNALIDSGGNKSLITKEYLEEKAQIKDKQIIISGDIDIQENWNGQTIIFKSSGIVRMPIIKTEEFSFNAITLEGVNLTWQWANQIEWVFGEPEITPEKKYFNLTKLGNTNQIILSV
ncbi:hypothetical protein [Flavobacterium sp. SLB02]|uniref:hypothetical protein n=1 Tax=Flavobacterium sp. SLB02 TaxID=2665645 RepID=UPI0012A9380B|nr:hypothetical protein [Flavobacterium sp. SLB02]QGK72798.1 hypothetical protein GIY83_01550 [Flavobacterium sp. SLB02]